MAVVKFSISVSPELYSALTRASLDARTNISREVETCLREHPVIQRFVEEVRQEPDTGLHMVTPPALRDRISPKGKISRGSKHKVPQEIVATA